MQPSSDAAVETKAAAGEEGRGLGDEVAGEVGDFFRRADAVGGVCLVDGGGQWHRGVCNVQLRAWPG